MLSLTGGIIIESKAGGCCKYNSSLVSQFKKYGLVAAVVGEINYWDIVRFDRRIW